MTDTGQCDAEGVPVDNPDRPKQTEFRVTLRFTASGFPAILRLRRFLKMAWRAYGLRCVRIGEMPPHGAGLDRPAGGKADGPG